MCAMGINGAYNVYYGRPRFGTENDTRKHSYLNPMQPAENKSKAGKVILTLAAVAAAIKFRKPIGSFISKHFPNLSQKFSGFKERASEIFNPIKETFTKWFKKAPKATTNTTGDVFRRNPPKLLSGGEVLRLMPPQP